MSSNDWNLDGKKDEFDDYENELREVNSMIQETFYSNGQDNFKDNIFKAKEWSAPIMIDVTEIKQRIAIFR